MKYLLVFQSLNQSSCSCIPFNTCCFNPRGGRLSTWLEPRWGIHGLNFMLGTFLSFSVIGIDLGEGK